MKNSWNIPADKDLTMQEIIKQGGYYDIAGLWNNITEIDGKIYRGRVETFVIDDEYNIFMHVKGNGSYRIPGGSFERNGDHIQQAYAEVLEEARIICDEITYTGVSYIKTFDKKIEDGVSWDGTYNEVYVAHYVGPYTGYIHPKNKDDSMYKNGKWYKYEEIEGILSENHKRALFEIFTPEEKDSETIPPKDDIVNRVKEMMKDIYDRQDKEMLFISTDKSINESNMDDDQLFYPMFSPEEMHEIGVMNEGHNFYCENVPIDNFTKDWFQKYEKEPNTAVSSEWFNQLRDLYIRYISNPNDTIRQQILNLGWNPEVPVNYDNVKKAAKLAERKKNPQDVVEIDENYIFSRKDNVYNFDKWDNGESNILIITGLSGSGKSTMAFALADEYDATVIQLDHLQCYERFTAKNKNTPGTELIKKFFKNNKELKKQDFSSITFSSFKPVFDEFFPWLLKELGKDKKNRYIIEGIHIILFTKYFDIKRYPLICINTPMYKSIVRHWIRDQFSIAELVKYGLDDIRLFKTWEDSYKAFYNSMGESSVEESSFISKLTLQSKIRKYNKANGTNVRDMADLLKHHKNPGLEEYVKKSRDIEELEYIRNDTRPLRYTLTKIRNRIALINQKGECKETKSYYKGIKKLYLDKGIRLNDVDKTLEWYEEFMKLISSRIKELKKKPINESSIENRDIMIFDLGSVLIDGNFKQALLNDIRIPNELVDELISAWLIKEDSSFTELCTKKEYIDKVYKNTPVQYHRYIPTVAEISISYLRPCDWTQSLISILRNKGYGIYYLSNWNKWSVNEIKKTTETMDFLDDLDGGVFSYETGYLKPDKRIYEFFLKKYNIDPNRAVFFDDKKENIEAAEKLGIKGILFSKDKGNEILADFIEGEENL